MMTQILVKVAEVQVLQGEAEFLCVGLGSCMGVALFDPVSDVAGMAHVVLPEAPENGSKERPGKCADSAIPHLLNTMERLGADRSRVVAAVAGGAQVCFGKQVPAPLALGARNAQAVQRTLEQCGVRCVGSDVGGNYGRTFSLETGSGKVTVRTPSEPERVLCRLK